MTGLLAGAARAVALGALVALVGCTGTKSASDGATATATSTSQSPGAGASTARPTISGVVFSGGTAGPVVTVRGTGFGVSPVPDPPYTPEGHAPCTLPVTHGNQGLDYGDRLFLADTSANWSAGRYLASAKELDCVGLIVTSFTPNQIMFLLGNAYAIHPERYRLRNGDSFTVGVKGASLSGKVILTG